MTTETIQLEGTQVGKITLLRANLPYKNGQRAKDKKTYNQYRYNGTVFNVDSENKFCKLYETEELYSVEFIEGQRDVETVDADGETTKQTVRTLEFDNCQSIDQAKKLVSNEVEIKKIYKSLETAPLTEETLNALMNS
jgi:hypothetical protein